MSTLERSVWAALDSRRGAMYAGAIAVYLVLFVLLRPKAALFSLVVLPGTLLHELSHWVAGIVLGGRPGGLRLVPARRGNQLMLGSVEFANLRWYNGVFIGLAPLSLLPAALALVAWRIGHGATFGVAGAGWAYVAANLVYAAGPSRQDLRIVAISRWMLVSAALLAAGWMTHF